MLVIPQFRLASSIEATKKIYDKFELDEANGDLVAKLLDYSGRTSGTFYMRMRDAQMYGLINVNRGKFTVTQLGKKITYPTSGEAEDEALLEAFLNIPLWKGLYDKYTKFGKEIPTEDLWVDIAKIAQIEYPKAKEISRTVKNAYMEDLSRIPTDVIEKHESEIQTIKADVDTKDSILSSKSSILDDENTVLLTFENMQVSLPKENTKKSWELLQKYMDVYFQAHPEKIKPASSSNFDLSFGGFNTEFNKTKKNEDKSKEKSPES